MFAKVVTIAGAIRSPMLIKGFGKVPEVPIPSFSFFYKEQYAGFGFFEYQYPNGSQLFSLL
jgi:hypothetical protein